MKTLLSVMAILVSCVAAEAQLKPSAGVEKPRPTSQSSTSSTATRPTPFATASSISRYIPPVPSWRWGFFGSETETVNPATDGGTGEGQ